MIIIGVCGGSGSGKTTLVHAAKEHLSRDKVSVISQDSFYKQHDSLTFEERCKLNFDHPDAIDYELFTLQLSKLLKSQPIHTPVYSFSEHLRTDQVNVVMPKPIVFVEGILIFAHKGLRNLFSQAIFIDAKQDTRLRRRIERDTRTRGRTEDEVKSRFAETIIPMHNQHIEPYKQTADHIFDNDPDDLSRLSSFCNLLDKLVK